MVGGQRHRTVASIPLVADGLEVVGVPVGTPDFCRRGAAEAVDKMCTRTENVQTALASTSSHGLFALTQYCLATQPTYLAQTMYPDDVRAALTVHDAAIQSCVMAACGQAGPLVLADEFAMRRLTLPARLKGLGFRSSAHVCDAAFIGAACRALPQLLDRTVALGGIVPGYCQALASTLGATSFDAANLSTRFARLVAQRGSLRLAAAFDDAYARLQTEVAVPQRGGT